MDTPYVLIVDDDTALLQALPQALYLRIPDIRVDTSDSAVSALERIKEHEYDAIVSDIKMPGMDGLVLLTKIQELRPETPTLLITGHGEHNLAIQALRGGAYDFIQKPIDRDYFTAALRRAIQTHQLRHQVKVQQNALEQHAQSLEQIIQERTRELLAANAAKDEFLGMASHELKTPLSSLKGMTQLLRRRLERDTSPEVTKLLNMERSIRRMERLVDDLLSTSFIETGMLKLQRQPCNMIEIAHHVIDEYLPATHPIAAITLEVPDEPLPVEVDVDRISQVLVNLLSNAYKYAPKNSPITMRLQRTGRQCVVSVQDKGVGIAPDALPHIFERFYRIPEIEVQTGSSVGLGLGLYISRIIVERHGGHIDVESIPGQGSTFSVSLPLHIDATRIDFTASTLDVQSSPNSLEEIF